MKRITDLLEKYNHGKLKALSKMFVEEPTEDEFNKELEEVKEKAKGKIRNKKIGDPAPACCESDLKKMDESEEEIKNRSMWMEPKKGYLDNARGGKPMTPEEKAKHHDKMKQVAKDIKSKNYSMRNGKVVEEGVDYDDEAGSSSHPISQYKQKNIKGLHSYTHYEHPDGKWFQVKHGRDFNAIYNDPKEGIKEFSSLNSLQKHIEKIHLKDKVVGEETNLDERSLSSDEEGKKEDFVKGMKKSSASFKKLYGDRAKSVMYATATKMAKEEFDFQEIDDECLTEEFINEWNASGHKQSKALKWIKANGFEPDRHSKHPAYKHIDTGKTVTAFNTHGNEVGAEALRNTRKMIIQHHQENGIKYKEL